MDKRIAKQELATKLYHNARKLGIPNPNNVTPAVIANAFTLPELRKLAKQMGVQNG